MSRSAHHEQSSCHLRCGATVFGVCLSSVNQICNFAKWSREVDHFQFKTSFNIEESLLDSHIAQRACFLQAEQALSAKLWANSKKLIYFALLIQLSLIKFIPVSI